MRAERAAEVDELLVGADIERPGLEALLQTALQAWGARSATEAK